jgi:hypothetical protein
MSFKEDLFHDAGFAGICDAQSYYTIRQTIALPSPVRCRAYIFDVDKIKADNP